MTSPLAVSAVEQQVTQAAGSRFSPLASGVVGGVRRGHLRLAYRRSMLDYNAKPILVGWILDRKVNSEISLKYRAPIFAYVFFASWYLFLSIMFLVLLMNGEVSFSGILSFFGVIPLFLHYVGTAQSDADLKVMLDFLAENAGARLVES